MKTSAYIQITGRLNQTGIGLAPNDTGGELDPHGADMVCTPSIITSVISETLP